VLFYFLEFTMPIHDWTRVDAGLFHAFHQSWIALLSRALNAGVLPNDYDALPEQSIKGPVPEVLTLRLSADPRSQDRPGTGPVLAVAASRPRTRLVTHAEEQIYVRKADRVTVRHRCGHAVAVVEVVSPGNKASRSASRAFVDKTADLIMQGVHLLMIDLVPPSKRDPRGIHQAIWDEFVEEDFVLPAGKPLTLAAYDAGPPPAAYADFVGVGDSLPDMPIFLNREIHVPAPLEATYQTTWDDLPGTAQGPARGPPKSRT
jgi:hypothetical protein